VTGIITVAAKKVGGMQRGKARACVRTQPKKPESSQRAQGQRMLSEITAIRKPQKWCAVERWQYRSNFQLRKGR